MKLNSILIAAAVVSLAGCSSFPGSGAKQEARHEAHHPAAGSAAKVDPAKVDQQMTAMQDMHRKMMAARTPTERAALRKDHMKAMQDGMAMMGHMGGTSMHGCAGSSMPHGAPVQKDVVN